MSIKDLIGAIVFTVCLLVMCFNLLYIFTKMRDDE